MAFEDAGPKSKQQVEPITAAADVRETPKATRSGKIDAIRRSPRPTAELMKSAMNWPMTYVTARSS